MYITKNINNFKSYNNKKIFIKHFHKKEFDDTNFKFSLPLRSKICVNNNNIIHTFNQYGTINKLVIFENIYTLYIGINIKLKSNIKLNNIVNTYHNNCVSYSYYDNNNILKKEGFIITFYQPRQYDYKIKFSKDGDYILIEEDNEYIEYEKETGLYIYNFNDNFYTDYTFSNNYSNYDYSELNYNTLPNNDFNYKQNQNKILENFNYDNYKLDSKTKNIELKYDNEKENNILDNENIQSNNENIQSNNENIQLDNENIQLDNENIQSNNKIENIQSDNEIENNLLDNEIEKNLLYNENIQSNNENIQLDNENIQLDNENIQSNNKIENIQLDNEIENIQLHNEIENNLLENEIENNLLYNENIQLDNENNQLNNENIQLDNENIQLDNENNQLDNENNQINNENIQLDNKNNQFDSNEFSYTPINYIHSLNKENMYEIIKIFYNNFQLKNKLINNIKLYLIIMVIIFLIIKII